MGPFQTPGLYHAPPLKPAQFQAIEAVRGAPLRPPLPPRGEGWGEGLAPRYHPPMTDATAPPEITLRPIATVRNDEHDLALWDWSKVESRIEFPVGFEDRLLGLDGYSHVIVVGWMDQFPREYLERPTAYPAGDEKYPLQGVLALRGGRPNPVSVTVCELRKVTREKDGGATLIVRGLDLVDGTPVIDVKPYVAHYDSVPKAKIPKWAGG